MMRKKLVLTIVAVALLACMACALFACETYRAKALEKVGDKDAVVESNGGLVVKQGSYLYFVNGYTGYLTEKGDQNWFGNVTKGAIVRVTYNEDGTLGDDYTVVVPKSVMASSEDVGFSIFGEWIYYVSPSAEENKKGEVQTDTLQFLRTKIDGTHTQVILNWDNTSVKYRYTADALVFFDDEEDKLYSKDLTVKHFKKNKPGDLIDEDVASVHFIKNETYDPKAQSSSVADYVLYTKNSEADYDFTNTLYVSDARGSEESKKVLIGGDTYEGAKYNINLLATSVTDGKLAIYYTKTSYTGTSSSGTVIGTYAYEFQDKTLSFVPANEKCLVADSLSSIYPLGYAAGVVKTSDNARIYHIDGSVTTYGSLDLSSLICVENGNFYYLSDSTLIYYPTDAESNAHFAYTTGEKFMSSFIDAEYFDGYIYFIQDDDYDYLARIKLADINIYADKEAEVTRIAIITEEDQEKMAEAEEEESDK